MVGPEAFHKFQTMHFTLNIADSLVSLANYTAIAGIFGLAFDKKILNKKFWSFFLPILILSNFLYFTFFPFLHQIPGDKQINTMLLGLIMGVTSFLLNIGIYLPLAFYAFKRNKLWTNNETEQYSLWKLVFFWVLFYQCIPAYLFYLLPSFSSLYIYEKVDYLLAIFLIIGLYGFALKKKFFNSIFWKFFSISYFVWLIVFFVLPHSNLINILIRQYYNIWNLISVVLHIIPPIAALYLYGFKSNEIWSQNQATGLQGNLS
jgi:hypothetical protein